MGADWEAVGRTWASGFEPAPSDWAKAQAKTVIAALAGRIRATRLVTMADGGVSVVFQRVGAREARVDITNEREIVVTLRDFEGGIEYREVTSSQVPETVTTFLLASAAPAASPTEGDH